MSKDKNRDAPVETPSPVPEATEAPRQSRSSADPTLLAAIRIDRVMSRLPPCTRKWVLAWLIAKYTTNAQISVQYEEETVPPSQRKP